MTGQQALTRAVLVDRTFTEYLHRLDGLDGNHRNVVCRARATYWSIGRVARLYSAIRQSAVTTVSCNAETPFLFAVVTFSRLDPSNQQVILRHLEDADHWRLRCGIA